MVDGDIVDAGVNTVRGAIAADALGVTLMHEHTAHNFCGAQFDYESDGPYTQLPRVVAQLREAKAAGIGTVLDAAPPDLGRSVEVDLEASAQSGVNVICVTGLYSALTLPYYENPYFQRDVERLTRNFVRELTVGIGDTGIRAGAIKVASPAETMTEYSAWALRAAGRAQAETGAPVLTHTEHGTLGVEQTEILAASGADLQRCVIGHNDTDDVDYLLSILERGAVLGFDRMGYEHIFPEERRMATLLELLGRGFERQIVLSSDCAAGWGGHSRRYTYVVETVLPRLRQAGVSAETIDTLMIENPRRLLTPGGNSHPVTPA